jgi:hypothetical protein
LSLSIDGLTQKASSAVREYSGRLGSWLSQKVKVVDPEKQDLYGRLGELTADLADLEDTQLRDRITSLEDSVGHAPRAEYSNHGVSIDEGIITNQLLSERNLTDENRADLAKIADVLDAKAESLVSQEYLDQDDVTARRLTNLAEVLRSHIEEAEPSAIQRYAIPIVGSAAALVAFLPNAVEGNSLDMLNPTYSLSELPVLTGWTVPGSKISPSVIVQTQDASTDFNPEAYHLIVNGHLPIRAGGRDVLLYSGNRDFEGKTGNLKLAYVIRAEDRDLAMGTLLSYGIQQDINATDVSGTPTPFSDDVFRFTVGSVVARDIEEGPAIVELRTAFQYSQTSTAFAEDPDISVPRPSVLSVSLGAKYREGSKGFEIGGNVGSYGNEEMNTYGGSIKLEGDFGKTHFAYGIQVQHIDGYSDTRITPLGQHEVNGQLVNLAATDELKSLNQDQLRGELVFSRKISG